MPGNLPVQPRRTPEDASHPGSVCFFDPDSSAAAHSLRALLDDFGHPTSFQSFASNVATAVARGEVEALIMIPGTQHARAGRVLELLAGSHSLHTTPVIVCLADGDSVHIASEYLESGADNVLYAPVDPR